MPKKKASPALTKLFVLDTNVLMHDPTSLFRFDEHDLFIPIITLEELDAHKKGMSEVARNARQASRFLDELVAGFQGDIESGISLAEKSMGASTGKLVLQTQAIAAELPQSLPMGKADNQILGIVMALQHREPQRQVILVSKDINMRIKRGHWDWLPKTTSTTRCWKIPTSCTPVRWNWTLPSGNATVPIWPAGRTATGYATA